MFFVFCLKLRFSGNLISFSSQILFSTTETKYSLKAKDFFNGEINIVGCTSANQLWCLRESRCQSYYSDLSDRKGCLSNLRAFWYHRNHRRWTLVFQTNISGVRIVIPLFLEQSPTSLYTHSLSLTLIHFPSLCFPFSQA